MGRSIVSKCWKQSGTLAISGCRKRLERLKRGNEVEDDR
jgi:hypothetical protein